MNTAYCRVAALSLLALAAGSASAARPSYDCTRKLQSTVEEQICADEKLAALDRKLAEVFKAAQGKSKGKSGSTLKAEQIGWIKGRNECWKSPIQQQCITDNYEQRIAELQARFSLVAATASVEYVCDGDSVPVSASFFATEPPSVLARRGDDSQTLLSVPSASGSRYEGRNVSLYEHQGEALITWGPDGSERNCRKK